MMRRPSRIGLKDVVLLLGVGLLGSGCSRVPKQAPAREEYDAARVKVEHPNLGVRIIRDLSEPPDGIVDVVLKPGWGSEETPISVAPGFEEKAKDKFYFSGEIKPMSPGARVHWTGVLRAVNGAAYQNAADKYVASHPSGQ